MFDRKHENFPRHKSIFLPEEQDILDKVERPGRYTGGEWNEKKKDPEKVKAKVALVFPDLYEIGMSYLGQKILYSILNRHPLILAERAYAPWVDYEQKLRTRGRPLCSLESKIPLQEFDIIGFSLLYELNYSNIFTVLDLARIPFFSRERDERYPLVIGGGPGVFNPEPIAPFFDLFVVGDGEEVFPEIVELLLKLKQETKNREEILRELSRVRGIYVPSLYEPFQPENSVLYALRPRGEAPPRIEKRVFSAFDSFPFPEDIIVPNIQTVFDRVAVEIARGCPQRCRFCQASSIYFPYRVKKPSLVIKNILKSLDSTGYESVSLSALSVSDYPYLDEMVGALMESLAERKVSLSLSSLRPGGLSSRVIKNIVRVRKTGFTLVPEAGTDRLRRVINKPLDEEEILEAATNAFSHGWRLLKLYFMVGLPTEKEEDLEGIVRLVEEVIRIGRAILSSPPRINLSLSSFIPKPHTPFQWLKMEEELSLLEKHRYLMSRLKKYRSLKFKSHLIKGSLLECIFSRGDRRLALPLLRAWHSGARFDSWKDRFDFRLWEKAFEEEKVDLTPYLASLPQEALLPWDHIDCGLKKSYLLQELKKALRGETTSSCLDTRCGDCQGCSFPQEVKKEFRDKVEIRTAGLSPLGTKSGEQHRYRAYYLKDGKARYISHLDLMSLIQRAFRRARISVLFSKGFHPKMLLSFPPAISLGMEGKAEMVEFKSEYIISQDEFLKEVNRGLPPGIEFFGLERVESARPDVNQSIAEIVYSLNLESREVKEAVRRRKKSFSEEEYFRVIQDLIDDYRKIHQKSDVVKIYVDEKESRLFILLKYSPHKGAGVQKIVSDIFGLHNPAPYMAREGFRSISFSG